jgi:hypothetical protein
MRKLLPFGIAAVAALALAAPASAGIGVDIVTEPGNADCTTSTCVAHVVSTGTTELEAHIFGFHTHQLDCNQEYAIAVNAAGNGTVSGFNFTGSADCEEIQPCAHPWGFTSEELGGGTGEVSVNACFDTVVNCKGSFDMTLNDSHGHVYTLSAVDQRIDSPTFGVDCEVTGLWEIEDPTFEIVHADD